MGRSLVYTGSSYYRRGRRHKTVRSSGGVGAVSFKLIAILSAGVLMSLYINNSIQDSNKTATIRQINNQQDDLTKQLEVYQVEQIRNQTAEKVKADAASKGMVQPTNQEQINQ